MRPIYIDLDPANEDTTGYASAVTGTTLTLVASEVGDDLAHKISLTTTAAESGKTATIVGTDADGNVQTEAVALLDTATATSLKYFLTVVSITASASIAATDIGWVDEFASRTYPMDQYNEYSPSVGLDFTGTMSLDVQTSHRQLADVGNPSPYYTIDPAFVMNDQEDMAWLDDATVAGQTADGCQNLGTWPVRQIRFVSNSYTSGAEVQASVVQSGSS